MTSENIMIMAAAIIAFILPEILQILKTRFGIESGKVKAILAFFASLIVGVIVATATGEITLTDLISFSNAESMLIAHSVIYSISQIFYQTYLKPKIKNK